MSPPAQSRSASTLETYSRGAIAFHWSIAALILANIPLGLVMEGQPMALKVTLVRTHASIGLLALGLTAGRIAWRLMRAPPGLPVDTPRWQAGLANFVHGLLYVAMVVLPLTGWGIIASNGKVMKTGFLVFGALRLPGLPAITDASPPRQSLLHERFDVAHIALAWVLMALLALHIGAALWHQFGDRRGGISRMLPPRRP